MRGGMPVRVRELRAGEVEAVLARAEAAGVRVAAARLDRRLSVVAEGKGGDADGAAVLCERAGGRAVLYVIGEATGELLDKAVFKARAAGLHAAAVPGARGGVALAGAAWCPVGG